MDETEALLLMAVFVGVTLEIVDSPPAAACRRADPGRRQAATNSFHLRTMYSFSSITAFQQAMPPMRCS